jgi:hypothetical protein
VLFFARDHRGRGHVCALFRADIAPHFPLSLWLEKGLEGLGTGRLPEIGMRESPVRPANRGFGGWLLTIREALRYSLVFTLRGLIHE